MGIRFVDGYPVAMSLVRRASHSVSRRASLPGTTDEVVCLMSLSFPSLHSYTPALFREVNFTHLKFVSPTLFSCFSQVQEGDSFGRHVTKSPPAEKRCGAGA